MGNNVINFCGCSIFRNKLLGTFMVCEMSNHRRKYTPNLKECRGHVVHYPHIQAANQRLPNSNSGSFRHHARPGAAKGSRKKVHPLDNKCQNRNACHHTFSWCGMSVTLRSRSSLTCDDHISARVDVTETKRQFIGINVKRCSREEVSDSLTIHFL